MGSPEDSKPANRTPVVASFVQNPSFMHKPHLMVRSTLEIWTFSLGIGALVFVGALALQWVIYDRLLHQDGLRLVGSVVSGGFATTLVHALSLRARRSRVAELRRLETIALMNHHIRNSLQTIVNCSGNSESAEAIRDSVNRIEWVLSDVLPGIQDEANSSSAIGYAVISVKSKGTTPHSR